MQQIPAWKADSRWAVQEIFHLLLHPKVHFSAHKNPLLDSTTSQLNPAGIITTYFFKDHQVHSPSYA
jgi:hypothetical protein